MVVKNYPLHMKIPMSWQLFQTTFQNQIYCTSILWFSSCCMHKDGQMDTWHSYFISHFTGMQTCLKQVWQIRSHVTKWKYFNTTGVLCATIFNLKNFLFYTNTEESKMRSLGCQYHRWQTDAPLCNKKPIYRGYQTQSSTHLWWGKESRLCGKILDNSSW